MTTAHAQADQEDAGVELVALAIARVGTPDAQLIKDLYSACGR